MAAPVKHDIKGRPLSGRFGRRMIRKARRTLVDHNRKLLRGGGR